MAYLETDKMMKNIFPKQIRQYWPASTQGEQFYSIN